MKGYPGGTYYYPAQKMGGAPDLTAGAMTEERCKGSTGLLNHQNEIDRIHITTPPRRMTVPASLEKSL